MKSSLSKFSLILLSLILAISACAPSPQRTVNDGKNQEAGITKSEDDLPPVVEQELVSSNDNFEKIIEEKGTTAADYETTTEIQNGEDIMYVGYTKLKNVKSVLNRNTKELEVSGLAEIMNADKKTLRVSQNFKIKGKYKAKTGTINLSPVGDEEANGVQIRAVVTCLQSEIEGKYDCARAIIDLFLKHQNNYYTEQLESTAFAKPQVLNDKEKKPTVQVEVADPAIENQVKETPDKVTPAPAEKPAQQKPAIETVIQTPQASQTATVSPTVVTIDESKEEADPEALAEVAEGDEDSVPGRYEGKAALVKLVKLFATAKDDEEDEDEEEEEKKAPSDSSKRPQPRPEDAAIPRPKPRPDDLVPVVAQAGQDKSGRLQLRDQAVGSPDNGRLRNASFLKTHLESYNLTNKIVIANSSTKNYYGTQEMMNVLEEIGNKAYAYQQNRIHISRISAKHGGRLPPSKSHQNGMDVDIGYPTIQGKVGFPIVASGGSIKKSDFSVVKTLALFKYLMTQTVSPVDRLFVDQAIINSLCREAKNSGKFSGSEKAGYRKLFENMQHVDGHGNHYHLRLRCTPNQPDCRHRIYRKMNSCG